MRSLNNLYKQFGDIAALNGCSFEVEPGSMLGFLGPNGAGKTTAMRSIFGLVRLDSGSVAWEGKEITPEERRRFGYMPEERGLYPKMKAFDHLVYLGRLHGMSRAEAGGAAGTWLDKLGLSERHQTPIEALSHGNQQRVQLAAALVHDPVLLVLDEPFSGLDPLASETMAEILTGQATAGKAVVFSSHQLDVVEDICEEVAIMDAGSVVIEGNVRALKDAAPIRHLELEVDGDPTGLLDTLNGVRHHDFDGNTHTVVIDAESDIRGFIARAEEVGRLRHFAYTTPSLNDLFREAVE